jgi:hypothetical protein
VEEITMNPDIIIFGLISAVVSSLIVYYSIKGYKNFAEDSKLASTKLVLKDDVQNAYRILAVSALLFSTFTLGGAFALTSEQYHYLQYLSEIGGVIFMIGLLIFHKKISKATNGDEEKEEE